jgi:GNAT superfamily N-acetyltransferase
MSGPPPGAHIRPYRPADHTACRRLWAELVDHRGSLYGRGEAVGGRDHGRGEAVGGRDHGDRRRGDSGAGFEEYLTRLDLSGMWVASTEADGVVGLVGLTVDGSVDPVGVTRHMRGRGIGRALLATVAGEGRRRGLAELTISPPARDHGALRSLHAAGFGAVSNVTLTYALKGRDSRPQEALDLYDLPFHT